MLYDFINVLFKNYYIGIEGRKLFFSMIKRKEN